MFGFDCEIRIDVADTVAERRIPAAKDRIEKLQQLRISLRDRLLAAQQRAAQYYNKRHIPKEFRIQQLVKLSTAHLKIKGSRKLLPRWIGPFRVVEKIGNQAYRLALPSKYARLHDVFSVQLLEMYNRKEPNDELFLPMPDLEDPEDEWEVEEILDRRTRKNVVQYLVKWAGWPSEYNSFEPVNHLSNAPRAIAAFERRLNKRKRKHDDDSDSDD